MPGQEELVVVGAGDRQWQAVDSGPVLEAAIVADSLRGDNRGPQIGQLALSEPSSASSVAEGSRRLGGGWGGGGTHQLLPRRTSPRGWEELGDGAKEIISEFRGPAGALAQHPASAADP
jgi:hypothetical protein